MVDTVACGGTSVSKQMGLCTWEGGTVNAGIGAVHMGSCDCIQGDMGGDTVHIKR